MVCSGPRLQVNRMLPTVPPLTVVSVFVRQYARTDSPAFEASLQVGGCVGACVSLQLVGYDPAERLLSLNVGCHVGRPQFRDNPLATSANVGGGCLRALSDTVATCCTRASDRWSAVLSIRDRIGVY